MLTREKAEEFLTSKYDNVDVLLIQEAGSLPRIIKGFACAVHNASGQGNAVFVRKELDFSALDFDEAMSAFPDNEILLTGVQIGHVAIISVYVRPGLSWKTTETIGATLKKKLQEYEH